MKLGTTWKLPLIIITILIGPPLSIEDGVSASFIESDPNNQQQITFLDADQVFPITNGRYIAWIDYRNSNISCAEHHNNIASVDNDDETLTDIYLYFIENGEEISVISNNNTKTLLQMFMDRILWVEKSENNSNLYVYDIKNMTISNIESFKNRIRFDYYNNHVFSIENNTLYSFDIESTQEMIVIKNFTDKTLMGFNGNHIVFTNNTGPSYQSSLNVLNISTHKIKKIVDTNSIDQVTMWDTDITYSIKEVIEDDDTFYRTENIYVYNITSDQHTILQYNTQLVWYVQYQKIILGYKTVDIYKNYFYLLDYENGLEMNFTTMNTDRFGDDGRGLSIKNGFIVWSDNWDGNASYEIGDHYNVFLLNLYSELYNEPDNSMDIDSGPTDVQPSEGDKDDNPSTPAFQSVAILLALTCIAAYGYAQRRRRHH